MNNKRDKYQGPERIGDDIRLALQNLLTLVSVELTEHEQHYVIRIFGLDQRNNVITGIAVYLVGAIASCIEFNLKIRAALFNEGTVNRDLYRDVVKVVGQDNNISNESKIHERNPWIWESICHLIFHMSLDNEAIHPPDRLLAKSSIHLNVKDHGLDVIALYGTGSLGITAGECKAYLQRPNAAIADAANCLREVDSKLRDAEIRAALSQFRPSLQPDKKNMLVGAFWHYERAYFPMVCCESTHSVDWTTNRKVLKRLKPPTNRKYLVTATIDNAELFFDMISDTMRRYVNGMK